jgi:predicted nucleotidyltransferase
LFGSYSRNKPHFGSDVDILIVVTKKTKDDFEKIYSLLYDLSLEYEWSPLILTKEELDKRKMEEDSFIHTILEEGREIWKKSASLKND